MANWETEHYVKITPRRKNDWGFASMGNDYNNFSSAEEYNAYYEKVCKQIVDNIQEHYKDYDIKFVEIATNEHEQHLEEKIDKLNDEIYNFKAGISDILSRRDEWLSIVDILEELNKIMGNKG